MRPPSAAQCGDEALSRVDWDKSLPARYLAHQPETLNRHPTDMRCKTIFLALAVGRSFAVYRLHLLSRRIPSKCERKQPKPRPSSRTMRKRWPRGYATVSPGPAPTSPGLKLRVQVAALGLPGLDDATADRIIAGRPYSSEHELLERHIISREEYNKIADSITVKK